MVVKLLSHTENPEAIIAVAAKLCYSKGIPDLNIYLDEELEIYLNKLRLDGHESPFEHASFTFLISNVSRSLLAQITRHRIASFSIQSQRYVDLRRSMDYVIPEKILLNEKARRIFDDTMEYTRAAYEKIYDELADSGTKVDRKALEDARAVLPNACCTNMVVTMNARELFHFFNVRCCNRAQEEIRTLARTMLEIVKAECPLIFKNCGPKCITEGRCPEKSMSCGNPPRELMDEIHYITK